MKSLHFDLLGATLRLTCAVWLVCTASVLYAACGSTGCSDRCFLYDSWVVNPGNAGNYQGYVFSQNVTPLGGDNIVNACANGTPIGGTPGLKRYINWVLWDNGVPDCKKDCGTGVPSSGAINTTTGKKLGNGNTPPYNTNCNTGS
jgi:hypothetical protein